MITLYTDGSSKGNPGAGGYAAILQYKEHTKELVGAFNKTTNNRMELMALIAGLEAITKKNQQIIIYTDSRYIVDAINKGWIQRWFATNFKKKKNQDLWRRLWQSYIQHQIQLRWVRGHAGHPQNERCDTLAVQAAEKGPWKEDLGYIAHTS